MEAPLAFITRINQFFGRRPGQSLRELKAEIDALGDGGKVELAQLFNAVGFPTLLPGQSAEPDASSAAPSGKEDSHGR